MPGLIKLVVLGLAAYAVWWVYSLSKRLRAAEMALKTRDGRKPGRVEVTQDLVACPRCGAYVAAQGASPCDRSDCPYR